MVYDFLLQELMNKLRDEKFKLADLGFALNTPIFHSKDVSTELLKCAIIISACSRALQYNTAVKHATATKQDSGGKGSGSDNTDIPDEMNVRWLLLEICESADGGEAYRSILWLCLHVQRHDFSTEKNNYFYSTIHFDLVDALRSASQDVSLQCILDNALNQIGEVAFGDLNRESQQILTKFLHMDNVDDWKQNVAGLKIKAISINSDLASGVMAWSSVDTIYIAADHAVSQGILSALAKPEPDPGAEYCLHILVVREGARCVARMRASITGLWSDPTSYSAEAVGIRTGLPLEDERVRMRIPFIRSFDLDAGHVAEQLAIGAVVDVRCLWNSLEIMPSDHAHIPACTARCQPHCPKEILRMHPDFLSGMQLSFSGLRLPFY